MAQTTFGLNLSTVNSCAIFRFMARPGRWWARRWLKMEFMARISFNAALMARSIWWVSKRLERASKVPTSPQEPWTKRSTKNCKNTKMIRDTSIQSTCKTSRQEPVKMLQKNRTSIFNQNKQRIFLRLVFLRSFQILRKRMMTVKPRLSLWTLTTSWCKFKKPLVVS